MRVRLGDDIDDFCIKCKRIMNHAVVSIVNDEPAKVRCRTCHSDHDYRHEQAPPKPEPKKKAFNEVLTTVDPTATPIPETILPDEGDADAEAPFDGAVEEPAEPTPPPKAAKKATKKK